MNESIDRLTDRSTIHHLPMAACLHLHGARPYFLIRPRGLGTPGPKIAFDQRQEEAALLRLWADPAALGA